MSDILASDAPASDSAVETPEPGAAAEVESVDSAEVIPKERFDGLMSKYQSEKRTLTETLALAEAEIERLQAQAEKEPEVADDGLVDEVRSLKADLLEERLSRARVEAVAKYPGAAPLADLIVGSTPAEIEAMAATLHERLAGISAPAEDASGDASNEDVADAASGAPEAPVAPVVGGAVAFDDSASVDDNIQAALAAKDFTAFLRAAEARADSRDAELTVG